MATVPPAITLLGHVCIDHNQVNGGPVTKQWGSPLLYMADYLDTAPYLIAPHGPDLYQHIDPRSITINEPSATRTLAYENIITGNQRTQRSRHVASARPIPITRQLQQQLAQTDIFVVAPITPHLPVEYLKKQVMSHLPPHAIKLLLPQGYMRHIHPGTGHVRPRKFSEADELVPLFDTVVISDEDGEEPFRAAQDWTERSPHTSIVVTQGSRGATIVLNSDTIHVPTVPISPEAMQHPPIGCGDVFSIAMLMSLHSGKGIVESVRHAHEEVRNKLLGEESKTVIQYGELPVEREATS